MTVLSKQHVSAVSLLQDDDSGEDSGSDDGSDMDADGADAKADKPQRAAKKVVMMERRTGQLCDSV